MVAASPCALAVAPLAYATAISSLASKVPSESFSVLGSVFFLIFIQYETVPFGFVI
jgi:hypothetical protein